MYVQERDHSCSRNLLIPKQIPWWDFKTSNKCRQLAPNGVVAPGPRGDFYTEFTLLDRVHEQGACVDYVESYQLLFFALSGNNQASL